MAWRSVATVVATLAGIAPGALYYYFEMTGPVGAAIVVALGAFIGFALSRPSVSKRRVFTTAGEWTPLMLPLSWVVQQLDPEVPPIPRMQETASVLRWRTPRAVNLAQLILSAGRLDLYPVLGEELMIAGCDVPGILESCRTEAGQHQRPVRFPGWLIDLGAVPIPANWLTNAVLGVARRVYYERRYDLLPILGDALLDAGCSDPILLEVCRTAEPGLEPVWLVRELLGDELAT